MSLFLNEGTPVSLIEAQASGNPIVTNQNGRYRNIVIENKTALISKNNDQEIFLSNLLTLINSRELRLKFSKLAIEKSKEFHYSYLIKKHKKII